MMKNSLRTPKLVTIVTLLVGLCIPDSLLSQETDLLSKVRENNIQAVKEMIAAGADINLQDQRTGYTVLMMTLNSRHVDMAKLLISEGADISLKANDGATALVLAAGCSQELVEILLSKGADINVRTDKGLGVFTQCVMGILSEMVITDLASFLLSKGAEIDEVNTTEYYGGYTPLFWAVRYNNEELVRFLIANGSDVNAKAKNNTSPLSIAVESEFDSMVKLLKSNGAE
ncbi:MAG: ankyrin repeat domain-containing protein [Bacteroidales bacterium]|nr:ankyrin repeat domain-containing protein [Bacteroidales bacterium]